jgi:hypothetical protein
MDNPISPRIIEVANKPAAAEAARPTWRTAAGWVAVAIAIVVQYGLFRQYALREIAWALPGNSDQCGYLSRSYALFETILSSGLRAGIKQTWLEGGANGTQLSIQASLLYLVLGPSRLSALTLGFAYFALFQVALVGTVRWLTGRWSAAFLGLGLLLAARSTFLDPGGIMDFRIDFCALSLFGLFLCIAIRSEMFRLWPWSAGVSAMAILLFFFRFLATTYLVGILGLLFVWFCLKAWICRADPDKGPAYLRRVGGLALVGILCAAVMLPAVLLKWHDIKNYYIDHLFNHENEVRCEEYGYTGTVVRLLYYPKSLLLDHAGPAFLWLGGGVLCACLALAGARILRKSAHAGSSEAPAPAHSEFALMFALLGAIVPLAVLTAYGSPSPVVGGIAVGALVWSILLTALRLLNLPRLPGVEGDRWSSRGLATLAAVAMLVGACVQFGNYGKHSFPGSNRAECEEAVRMYDIIGQHAHRMKWTSPSVAHNVITDTLHAWHINTVAYELHGVNLSAREKLAKNISAVSEAEALAAIGKCNFAVLQKHTASSVYPYPINIGLRGLYPKLEAACERSCFVLGRFRVFGDEVTVYARAAVEMKGATVDNWITSDGLVLSAPAEVLRDRPHIELVGKTGWGTSEKAPVVTAELVVAGQSPRKVQAALSSDGSRYTIEVQLKPDEIPDVPQVDIRLAFDRYFMPSAAGNSPDSRHLVIRSPDETLLLRDLREP